MPNRALAAESPVSSLYSQLRGRAAEAQRSVGWLSHSFIGIIVAKVENELQSGSE